MPVLNALDYSYSRPNAQQLAASGIQLVCRYLSFDTGKNLTIPEAQQLHAAGIGILPNWESDPGRPLLGAAAGTQDGMAAASLAGQIGIPHGTTIIYSCDRDINSTEYPAIDAYYQAAAAATAGRYLVGVYGEDDLLNHLHANPAVTAYWQTLAWSGGLLSPYAGLYQYAINQTMDGASVDYDTIINAAALGAWWPLGYEPSGGGTPIPTPDPEDDMLQPFAIYVVQNAGLPNQVSWLIALDQSSKVQQMSAAQDALTRALSDFGGQVVPDGPWYKTASMTDEQIAAIPDLTVRS